MPGKDDDFAGLAKEMGLSEPVKSDPIPTPAPTPAPQVDPEPITEPEVEDVVIDTTPEPIVEPVKDPVPALVDPKINQAMAEQRVQNKKYKDAIKAAATAANLSEDEYLAKIQSDALVKRAEDQKIPPEMLRRMEALEAEVNQSREALAQQHLSQQFGKVQATFGITDSELTEFVNQLATTGHNFQNTNADYELLYRGLNHTKLVEKERQAWLADTKRAQAQGSKPNAATGRQSPEGSTKINSMEDMNAVLEDYFKK
jgi:hypothetical protein